VVRHAEAASADKFKTKFAELMEKEEGYFPQLVFNVDEIGLLWKKIPRRTYITKDEIALPGHNPMLDRLTLLLGYKASGDFKLNPMPVYHYDNPRVFKKQKVIRGEFGVFWKSNRKAWFTR
jgi:hypothetical protein